VYDDRESDSDDVCRISSCTIGRLNCGMAFERLVSCWDGGDMKGGEDRER
jgi:hypothetical protein